MKEKTKKGLRITAVVLLSLLCVYIVITLLPRPRNYKHDNNMMKSGDLPLLIAHGGGNQEFPDNTLEAFYNAYDVDNGVMMETDVSLTKDGVLLLSHDVTLDRKTNVTGYIADWNYSDLMSMKVDFNYSNPTVKDGEGRTLNGERQRYKDGYGNYKLPVDVNYPDGVEARDETVFLATTLEDLLVAFPSNRINVEIKQSGETGKKAFAEAVRLLEKHDAFGRVVLASFHNEIYSEFKQWQKQGKVAENFMYSPGTSGAAVFFVLQTLALDVFFGDGMCVFQLPMEQLGLNLATKKLVNAAHRHNLAVHYWTIDDEDDMRYLIDIGADGIMTNYPHRLKNVYDSYR